MHRFDPFCQITYAPNTVLPVVFLAPTQKQFNAVYTSEGYITAPSGMVETSREHFSGSLQEKQPHSVTLWTDASTQGWGAHLEDHQISGVWSTRERDCHINWLEMRAVQLALIHFESILLNKRVLLRCDNSTVVSYVNREGGTKSFQLCCLVWEIFNWCKIRKIVIRAAHIPRKKNVLADNLSRGRQGVRITEWSLKQELVNQFFLRFSTPNIDLFATRENKKLPVFCSPFPDQLAWAVDALSVHYWP